MRQLKPILSMLLIALVLTGCFRTVDWHESFRFKGTVEEILVDKDMLVIREFDAPESRNINNIFEIPTDNIEEYEVGEKLLIIVEANTLDDVWNLEHMRFEIKPVKTK